MLKTANRSHDPDDPSTFRQALTLAFRKVDIRNEQLPDSLLCQLRCISRAAHLPTSSADTIGIL
jgi:hypothetical protein